jgi:DNA polymerase-3 subunit alpha (Gram-positive type)
MNEIKNYNEIASSLEGRFLVVLDTETTSLSPYDGRMTEFGAIVIDPNGVKIAEFDTLINPEMPIPDTITQITGITDEMVSKAPTFQTASTDIYNIISYKNPIIVGHNVNFDLGFLRESFKRLGIKLDLICTDCLCTRNFDKEFAKQGKFDNKGKNGLEHLALNVFGIPDPGHHRALNDVIVCYELLKKLIELAGK